jgi:hypothetical protein
LHEGLESSTLLGHNIALLSKRLTLLGHVKSRFIKPGNMQGITLGKDTHDISKALVGKTGELQQ